MRTQFFQPALPGTYMYQAIRFFNFFPTHAYCRILVMLFFLQSAEFQSKCKKINKKEADVVFNCSGTSPPSPGNQETLRKVDWDEFQLRISAMNAHWYKSHRSKSGASDDSFVDVVGSRGFDEGDGAKTAEAEAAVAASSNVKDSPVAATTAASGDGAVDPVVEPGPEPETGPEAAELKARTLELIQDFPRLVRDFDRFIECIRIMTARYKR